MKISRIRGTEDKIDLTFKNFICEKVRTLLSNYNFSEIETPIIEPEELICRSLGQETDVVTKEMFRVTATGNEKMCLRPEATASTTRAYLENKIEEKPWNVFSIGPMFRHERPQKGRWRQFDQINIETINARSIGHDAQFLAMLERLFSEMFKLSDYVLAINFLGTLEERRAYRENLKIFLEKHKEIICETCLVRKDKNPLRVLDCKSPICQKIYENAPVLTDQLGAESQKQWDTFKEYLKILSISFIEDPKLVRGLDYYEGVVFEFSSPHLGAQSSFAGGGRYELATVFEAKEPVPSLGVGIGFGRLRMLIEQNAKLLSIPQKPALNLIIPMTEEQQPVALLLAESLRHHGKCVQILFDYSKLQKMMKKANKMGAKHVLIIGEDEQAFGNVTVKDMVSGANQTVAQSEAFKVL
ncbi:histidine--tRNA ligase [Candidatus Babeliales bacterium]|nr:histidine--tRNA ligase [Candidatus Babeliales bacterium]